MRMRTVAFAVATVIGLGLGSNARASLPLDVAGGSDIMFASTGSGANITFPGNFSATNTGDSALVGTIGGTFNYLTSGITSQIVAGNTLETVNVTGTGSLSIADGSGYNLTGTITGFSLSYTYGSGGDLNENAVINLTGLSYSGSNADLQALAASGQGIFTVTFQFTNNNTTLESLAANGGHASWSGSMNAAATPEPSTMAIAGLSALGMIGYGLRRRKALGA